MSAGIERSGLVLPLSVRRCSEKDDDSSLCIVNANDVIVAHSPHATRYREPLQRMVDARNFAEISLRMNSTADSDDVEESAAAFLAWFERFMGSEAVAEINCSEIKTLRAALAKAVKP